MGPMSSYFVNSKDIFPKLKQNKNDKEQAVDLTMIVLYFPRCFPLLYIAVCGQ